MRVWVAALALTLAATAADAAGLEYDLTWTTFAREARWRNGETQPVAAGERSGRALATLTSVRPGVLRLQWRGEGGDGSGLIGPAGPTRFTFPSPLVIAGPPPLPHLSGGSFEFSGDPDQPDTFTVSYVEGFICRSTPAVCFGVQMWERRFDGRATRRIGQSDAAPGLSRRSRAAATPLASSLGVNGLSTMLCTPLSVALPITSRVPWAVIITTRRPGRSTHARRMNSMPFSSGIL
jgi:hypothetical protein